MLAAIQVAICLTVMLATASGKSMNLLWPGSSWASIACGAQYQQLVSQGYEIQHIIGASGGAASAVMMLADPNPASLNVLKDTYSKHGKKCDFSTTCWAETYQNLMENIPGAFARVKEFGKVSIVCDHKHYILYNFTDAEQAGQAYAAAGGSGPVKGISKSCGDGGQVKQKFPDSMSAEALSYFATPAPQEGASGGPSFPTFCPNSLNVILVNGYNCIDFLVNQTTIHPEKYTQIDDGIKNLHAFGSEGTWKDCGGI
jgi:hypothetical protein